MSEIKAMCHALSHVWGDLFVFALFLTTFTLIAMALFGGRLALSPVECLDESVAVGYGFFDLLTAAAPCPDSRPRFHLDSFFWALLSTFVGHDKQCGTKYFEFYAPRLSRNEHHSF
jgi:hypothetical protein